MNIINSDLSDTKYDVLWDDVTPLIGDATVKPFLIIVNSCEPGSTEDTQLQKMLGPTAANLVPEQYNIIRLKEDQMLAWHRLREQLNPQIIFLIGVSPAQLGISALFSINVPNGFNDRVWLPTLS